MNDLILTVNERAQKVLHNQRDQVRAANRAWVDRPNALDALLNMSESLTHCLSQAFTNGFGDSRIVGTDELSLEIYANSGYTIGMVFFPQHPRADYATAEDTRPGPGFEAPLMGRYCWHHITGVGYCLQPIVKGEHAGHAEHAPDIFAMPILGDWSLHS